MFLFFISFGASALNRIFKADWSQYLVRNRRYYGISTAIVLWSHWLVILSLSVTAPEWFEESAPWYILYSGTGTFILVGLMGLTSNNFAVRKMGARSWKTLHLVGGTQNLARLVGRARAIFDMLATTDIPTPDFELEFTDNLFAALDAMNTDKV